MNKRIVSFLLAILLVITLLPMQVWAAELANSSKAAEDEIVFEEEAVIPPEEFTEESTEQTQEELPNEDLTEEEKPLEKLPETSDENVEEPAAVQTQAANGGYVEVYTADDLYRIRDNLAGNYTLMDDIDLSSWENWEPIGQEDAPFQGTFDGNGHIIRNMKIDSTKTATEETHSYYYGLFGYISGGTISSVGIVNASINVSYNSGTLDSSFCEVGGLAGYITKSTISKSFFIGSITVSATGNTYVRVAGITAETVGDSSIVDCFSNAHIKAEAEKMNLFAAGIAAYLDHGSVVRCYVTGTISAKDPGGYCYFGGINASATRDTIWGIVLDYFGSVQKSIAMLRYVEVEGARVVQDDIGKLSQNSNCKVLDVTSEEASTQATYTALGWDFTNTWKMSRDLPCLQYHTIAPTIFSAKQDGWSFRNNWDGFAYSADYFIPEERYAEVFGPAFVAAAKLAGGKTLSSMIPQTWSGSCYGMCVAALLFYQNRLDWSEYNDLYENDFSSVNSYYSVLKWQNLIEKRAYACSERGTPITTLIEQFHVFQRAGRKFTDDQIDWTSTYVKPDGKKLVHIPGPDGTYISSLWNCIQNGGEPILLKMVHGKNATSHAVISRTDKKPLKMDDGWYRVYIYDPNNPYMSSEEGLNYSGNLCSYYLNLRPDDRYIELNPDSNQWRYISDGGTYWGTSKDGKVLTYARDGCEEIPDVIIASTLSNDYPTSFNGTAKWVDAYLDAVNLLISAVSTLSVFTPSGEELCRVENGQLVSGGKSVEYYPNYGYVEGAEDQSNGGQLIIPATEFTIQYESGDDISIIGDDDVINIATDGRMVLDISTEENSIKVSGGDTADIAVQITDVYNNADYTSAEVNGKLASGDGFSMSLTNDELNISGDLDNSQLTVYTDNAEQPEATELGKVSGADEDMHVPDVRKAASSIRNFSVTPEKLLLTIGEKAALAVTVSDAIAITWTSSDPQIASVDEAGIVTGVANGTAIITATVKGGYSASCQVTVAPPLMGDVNRDRLVNVFDVQRLYEHLIGTNPIEDSQQLNIADINNDDAINVYDLQQLYEIVAET